MRIAYLISSLKIGGAEVALAQLAPKIQEKGYDVFVAFFHDGPIRERLAEVRISAKPLKGLISCYDPVACWRLYRWLRKVKPDVLHTSLWSANIIGRLIGWLLSIPVVSDLHGNCLAEGVVRNLGDRLTAGFSMVTIAVSESVAVAYKKHILGVRPIQLVTVPNAIDTAAIAKLAALHATSRAAWGIPADAFVIGGVGRLEPIKGFDLLIEAFALLPKHAYLVVVGDGSQRQALAQQAERLGVAERCIITGFRKDVVGFYRLFDCFAIVSHSEGLSMALLEAMALGCPVVTTNATLEHDVITNQHTGLIVTSRVPAEYAGVLVSLMQDALLQKRLGQEAMAMVHARYDVARVVAAIESLYYSVKNSI